MISLRNLHKSFPGPAGPSPVLRDISLTIDTGEVFGIIGRSGAGKSTLVRCINLLERPNSGTVEVAGKVLTTLPEQALRQARRGIGMVFQHFNLLSSRTVRGNIALPLELTGEDRAPVRRRVDDLLDLVGLTDRADAYPAELSGGQKQRVGIARALAARPQVLLCDEATSALDPETTQSILALLKDINRTLDLTIVLITHEMQVIKSIADRVAVLDQGRVVEQGRLFDVFTQPRHDITAAFVREALNREVPEVVTRRLHALDSQPDSPATGSRVIRITFLGPAAHEPVVSDLIRRFDLSVNLLHGHIDYIRNEPFGTLLVEITGTEAARRAALNYLSSKSLIVEGLGRADTPVRVTA